MISEKSAGYKKCSRRTRSSWDLKMWQYCTIVGYSSMRMRHCRLQWCEHASWKDDSECNEWVKNCEVEGVKPRGRPNKRRRLLRQM